MVLESLLLDLTVIFVEVRESAETLVVAKGRELMMKTRR